ncbi:mannose-1-phosphate guanyltransferase alpha-A-like protein [Leptotrombidium deliense]|uniref:Mannose-1-phosphate guanyltransferase alpha-A-like protein n=1 Tax=Leptotrombidium deliense TaxID=299467 RepID=A0A443S6F3_9ACAR|nr:mannose-1-phosphate guanyltransferase alpha-A-like protein [Leptotrombidium deliense]
MKAVILIGGPQKGTRFRPLSFDLPKPLFPVAGCATLEHLIDACAKVTEIKEILLIGFYQQDESLSNFITEMVKKYSLNIKYLQEYTSLGTAGGIYHFRDQIRRGNPQAFFLINGDVCGNFDFNEMVSFHCESKRLMTVMVTEATRQQSINYGCIVEDKDTNAILHFVEKPSTFVSTTINCGVYLCDVSLFEYLAKVYRKKHEDSFDEDDVDVSTSQVMINGNNNRLREDKQECISLEKDIVRALAGSDLLYAYHTNKWWSQIKTAASAIYANRHYLALFRETRPTMLAANSPNGPKIIGDVHIHSSAMVDPTATVINNHKFQLFNKFSKQLGPNVSIGPGVKVGAGVRIKESIILGYAVIYDHTLIMHSIVGWKSIIGSWTRVEGTPSDPNPNKPFAKMENQTLFRGDGKLNPSITVLGSNVQVSSEVIVLNSIVLPHKELTRSYKNEIIL